MGNKECKLVNKDINQVMLSKSQSWQLGLIEQYVSHVVIYLELLMLNTWNILSA